VLRDDITQSGNFGIAITDRLERIDLIADLQPFVTIEPIESLGFLAVEVAQQGVGIAGRSGVSSNRL
jgi:hypothetical protein